MIIVGVKNLVVSLRISPLHWWVQWVDSSPSLGSILRLRTPELVVWNDGSHVTCIRVRVLLLQRGWGKSQERDVDTWNTNLSLESFLRPIHCLRRLVDSEFRRNPGTSLGFRRFWQTRTSVVVSPRVLSSDDISPVRDPSWLTQVQSRHTGTRSPDWGENLSQNSWYFLPFIRLDGVF